MSVFKKMWQWITGTTPTTKVIILSLGEEGKIEDSRLDEGQKAKRPAIRITDFPINMNEFSVKEKNIDWKEFPLWRKQQLEQMVVHLQWAQVEGYLV